MKLAFLGQVEYLTAIRSRCKTLPELLAVDNNDKRHRNPKNCGKINAIHTPYFDGGLVKMTRPGRHGYFSSRNNNFSNRKQAGMVCVAGTLNGQPEGTCDAGQTCLDMLEKQLKTLQATAVARNHTTDPTFNRFWRRDTNAVAEAAVGAESWNKEPALPPAPPQADPVVEVPSVADGLATEAVDPSAQVTLAKEVTGDTVTTKDSDAEDPRMYVASPEAEGMGWVTAFLLAFFGAAAVAGALGYYMFPWIEGKMDECIEAQKASEAAEAAAKPKLVSKSSLRTQFEQFDSNGDGNIDFEEFTAFCEANPSGVTLAKTNLKR
jgi:hypothetical protein